MTEHTEGKAIDEILWRLLADVDDRMEFAGTIFKTKETAAEDVKKSVTKARQALYTLFEKEVIGEDDAYDELCEHCNNWDDGRNSLRESQRATLRKLLG